MTLRAGAVLTPPPEEVQILPCPVCGTPKEHRVRRLDVAILAVLERDGAIREEKIAAVAEEIGASVPVLFLTLHRLRKEGVLAWGWLRPGWGFVRAQGVA